MNARLAQIVTDIGDARMSVTTHGARDVAWLRDRHLVVAITSTRGDLREHVRITDASGRHVIMEFFSTNTRRTVLAVRDALRRYGERT